MGGSNELPFFYSYFSRTIVFFFINDTLTLLVFFQYLPLKDSKVTNCNASTFESIRIKHSKTYLNLPTFAQ